LEEKESHKERLRSSRLRTSEINYTKTFENSKPKPLKGIARQQALELLKNPSKDHLKPFILCRLNEDCRYCRFRETCKTNAIAYINGLDMPYEPYWFRKAIANEIDKHTK
jgi:hypothetical protein